MDLSVLIFHVLSLFDLEAKLLCNDELNMCYLFYSVYNHTSSEDKTILLEIPG